MADIAKKCNAAIAETKKAIIDVANDVKKWRKVCDDIQRKKVDAKNRDKIVDQADKAAKAVLKSLQDWTKLCDDLIQAVKDVDERAHDLSKEVEEYDILIKRIVPGLKQALELEEAEMIRRIEELLDSF